MWKLIVFQDIRGRRLNNPIIRTRRYSMIQELSVPDSSSKRLICSRFLLGAE